MHDARNWLREVGTEVVGGLIGTAILASVTIVFAYLTENQQLILPLVAIVLLFAILIAAGIIIVRLRQQYQEIRQSLNDLHSQAARHSQELAGLMDLVQQSPLLSRATKGRNPDERLDKLFPFTNRYFDEISQKIVYEFTNQADSPFFVKKIIYSDKELKDSSIEYVRKELHSGRVEVDFDESKAHVAPGEIFPFEIRLKQSWKSKDINLIWNNLGYLSIFADHKGKEDVELWYPI